MDSRHVEKGPGLTSKNEDLEELSPVVDGKVVSDNRSLPKSVVEAKLTLEKIVLAIVVVGIIVFASFQISECVSAHENPSSQTRVENVNRTFPGLMFCPFGRNSLYDPGLRDSICPKWAPDASLSFDFRITAGNIGNGYSPDAISLYNTNVDSASQVERSDSCSLNQVDRSSSSLFFVASKDTKSKESTVRFERQVTVKNSAPPRPSVIVDGVERQSCNSWTPPNVQCLVYDPSTFDEATKTIPGLNSKCNAMRELKANTVDSLAFLTKFDTENPFLTGRTDDISTMFGGYTYSGLIQQRAEIPGIPGKPVSGDKPRLNPFATAPSSLSMFTQQLVQQGLKECSTNVNMSLFGGIVAVLYDVSKGIPTALNFDGARTNAMSTDVLGSTALLTTLVKDEQVSQPYYCQQEVAKPLTCTVTEQRDVVFTNAILQKKETVSRQLAQFQQPAITAITDVEKPLKKGTPLPALSISFASSSTVISTQVISLSILTTISIIVSTAATLWGSQQKIHDGIILVIDKVKEFLDKRRTPT